jgi:hypothetical protein
MELKCLEFLYKEKPVYDKEGNPIDVKEVPVKLGFITKMEVDEEDILAFKELPNSKGNIYKQRCLIHHRTLGNMVVKHSFQELKKIAKKKQVTVKGFYGK